MRKWFSESDDDSRIPALAPKNWPGSGATRADTLQADLDGSWHFDNQSDDQPQKLTAVLQAGLAHPILQGPDGPLAIFPDHMHEGEVALPWTLNDTLTFNGQSFLEYPSLDGHQEGPSIIARGTVNGGHTTVVEGSLCEQQNFVSDGTPTAPGGRSLDILCAYDGHKVGVGRVVTDSSFHHYIDLNVIGDPCGVAEKQQGLTKGPHFAEMAAFYNRTVLWLAPKLGT